MRPLKRSAEKMYQWVNGREHVGRARRVMIRMPVLLELAEGRLVEAMLADLSSAGFKLRCGSPLRPGQEMMMRLPHQRISCEVRWVNGDEAGGLFHRRQVARNGQ
jgi:hypothetical protein